MFPGADDYGEQIDYFEECNPHIHYYLRKKGEKYTAFAFVASVGQNFSQKFEHEPTRDEILERFSKDGRLNEFLK